VLQPRALDNEALTPEDLREAGAIRFI